MAAKSWKILGSAIPVPLLIALLIFTASPAQALVVSAPAPNVLAGTSSISVTLTFEDGDVIPIDELQLVFTCSATGSATDRFNVDGSAIAQTRTTGSAVVTGSPAGLRVFGPEGGYQTGYGYGYLGHGAPTGERGFSSGYGYGYGYGYNQDSGAATLTYRFTLLRSAFAMNESCTVVLVVDTPVAGDFDSPRSVAFKPRVPGGGGGGGGGNAAGPGSPGNTPGEGQASRPADSDGDGIPDAVEAFLGTDPNDADSKPSKDFSSRVTITRTADGFTLSWENGPGFRPMGFQVWRSNSPFVLRATLDGNATGFIDAGAPAGSVYKVTWFTDLTEEGGYFADAARAVSTFGWTPASAGESQEVDSTPRVAVQPMTLWLIVLVIAVGAVVVVAAVVLRRKP